MVAWLLPAIGAIAALSSANTASKSVSNAERADKANEELSRENLAFQREQHEYDKYANSPQGLREMSEKAGFNPLAFMGQNIGPTQSFGGAPLMTDSTTGALMTLSATQMDIANIATRFQELQNDKKRVELMAQELMQKTDRNIGPYGNNKQTELPKTTLANAFDNVNVYDPQGNPKNIPLSIANRLGMREGDIFMVEDWEALIGELGAEAMGVSQVAEQNIEPLVRDGHIGDGRSKKPKARPMGGQWGDNPVIELPEIVVTNPWDLKSYQSLMQ